MSEKKLWPEMELGLVFKDYRNRWVAEYYPEIGRPTPLIRFTGKRYGTRKALLEEASNAIVALGQTKKRGRK
jgi:hypothetical protein